MNNKSILNAFKHKILNEAPEMSEAQIEVAEQLADKVMSELSLNTELYYDNNEIEEDYDSYGCEAGDFCEQWSLYEDEEDDEFFPPFAL